MKINIILYCQIWYPKSIPFRIESRLALLSTAIFVASSAGRSTVEDVSCIQRMSRYSNVSVLKHIICPRRSLCVTPRRGLSSDALDVKPYYVTTPIFYPNAGMSDC